MNYTGWSQQPAHQCFCKNCHTSGTYRAFVFFPHSSDLKGYKMLLQGHQEDYTALQFCHLRVLQILFSMSHLGSSLRDGFSLLDRDIQLPWAAKALTLLSLSASPLPNGLVFSLCFLFCSIPRSLVIRFNLIMFPLGAVTVHS